MSATDTNTTYGVASPSGVPFQSYSVRFPAGTLPLAATGDAWQSLYYSQALGPVHLLVLNQYVPYAPGSAQYAFAAADLAAASANRAAAPWLVVAFHAPFYHSYVSHYKEQECFRQVYEPLLYAAKVDFVLSGHGARAAGARPRGSIRAGVGRRRGGVDGADAPPRRHAPPSLLPLCARAVHAFERTHPMNNYTLDACGPVYLTVGDGGNLEGCGRRAARAARRSRLCLPPPSVLSRSRRAAASPRPHNTQPVPQLCGRDQRQRPVVLQHRVAGEAEAERLVRAGLRSRALRTQSRNRAISRNRSPPQAPGNGSLF